MGTITYNLKLLTDYSKQIRLKASGTCRIFLWGWDGLYQYVKRGNVAFKGRYLILVGARLCPRPSPRARSLGRFACPRPYGGKYLPLRGICRACNRIDTY